MCEEDLAVLSDIHGNRWALEAVLADIDRRGVLRMVNLGDSLYGPLDPAGTADMLIGLGLPTVRGNEDRMVVETSSEARSPTLRLVSDILRQEHLSWLERLEPTAVAFDTFFLCHGSPARDTEYLLWEVRRSGTYLRATAELEVSVSEVRQGVVLCGHDHLPRTMRLPNGIVVTNPGSVGLPAYSDDVPFPHFMQTGAPHARYAILHGGAQGWIVEDIAVPYDWEAAARVATENGRPDWAAWLSTGRSDTA